MQAKPNFQTMTRQELMKYLEKNFDEQALFELEKRQIPQSILDEHQEFIKWKKNYSDQ